MWSVCRGNISDSFSNIRANGVVKYWISSILICAVQWKQHRWDEANIYLRSSMIAAGRHLCISYDARRIVLNCFKDFQAYAETQTGRRVKRFRTDNGLEYTNKQMRRHLRQCGIQHETSVPYNPELNGLAERMNWSIVERALQLCKCHEL